MSRLPAVNREVLAPENQEIWDNIAAVRPGMRGPYGVLMHVPALAARVAALEDYFRFDAALSEVDRELIVLATVREMGARYAWARHELRGREVGIPAETIDTLRANGTVDNLAPRERLIVEVVRTLIGTRGLPDALYARAQDELGRQQLIELVALVGHYNLVGFLLNGFEVPPPAEGPNF